MHALLTHFSRIAKKSKSLYPCRAFDTSNHVSTASGNLLVLNLAIHIIACVSTLMQRRVRIPTNGVVLMALVLAILGCIEKFDGLLCLVIIVRWPPLRHVYFSSLFVNQLFLFYPRFLTRLVVGLLIPGYLFRSWTAYSWTGFQNQFEG